MITKKELVYVNAFVRNTPYPGDDYCEKVLNELENSFKFYNEYFFNGQEVVLPTQILVDRNDNLDKIIAPSSSKIRLLRDYRNIITSNGFPDQINIYNDYLSFLINEEKKEGKVLKNKEFLEINISRTLFVLP